MITLGDYLMVSGILFAIGFAGVMLRRNLIIIFMSLELMLNAANLSLVAFSRFRVDSTGPRNSRCSLPGTPNNRRQRYQQPEILSPRITRINANNMTEIIYKTESYAIIGACFEVYNEKDCGCLEPVYQECKAIEFEYQRIPAIAKPTLTLSYHRRILSQTYEP